MFHQRVFGCQIVNNSCCTLRRVFISNYYDTLVQSFVSNDKEKWNKGDFNFVTFTGSLLYNSEREPVTVQPQCPEYSL